AKATAALRGESLREFISAALETRLGAARPPAPDAAGWRRAFGLADRAMVADVDRLIDADLERVDPSEWR
ncbi:MAG TPA: hypothetical protein VMS56_15555, partial [Thermoanaerobaculia bacterium]|nr:hypothetical protein [Thermoanaerobaculia bacterium]